MKILTETDVRELLRKECAKAGSQRKWAAKNDFAHPVVSNVLTGKTRPGPKFERILGLTRIWTLDGSA